jgi:hypothetical protein
MTIMTGRLRRYVDVSQVSGTGDVAEFCEFSDGTVAVRWFGEHPSTAVWGDIRDIEFIHGHGGKTVLVFDEPRPEAPVEPQPTSKYEHDEHPLETFDREDRG